MQPPVSAERPIIFSLHGIRTGGAWQKADLTRVLSEAGFDHLALDFGFFRALRLLRPAVRRRQVDWFRDRYTAEMRGQSSLPSIIAHSFGTYIVAEAMRIYPEVRFNQVILCGSIVQQDFPWSELIDEDRVRRVLNDCGQQDFWAGVVVWAVDDAGPSGVKGFSDTAGGLVLQRSHPDWRHSDFFYELNYRRNWIPFLQGNMPGPPGTAAGRTTNWRFRLAVLMCLALLATLSSILYQKLVEYNREDRRTVQAPPLARNVWPEKFDEVSTAQLLLLEVDDELLVTVNDTPLPKVVFGVAPQPVDIKSLLRRGSNKFIFVVLNGLYGGCSSRAQILLNGIRSADYDWKWEVEMSKACANCNCITSVKTLYLP